ncbi:UDP-N-acetylglucosamine transferase subunit ALG13 [Geranomyces variabilis]|nr:UDP-N-acetylglucosamine transferase subunit ALG13 [Geranomyces variabilis]
MSAFPPIRGVFVTVGTTRFDALVNEVCTIEFLAMLRSKGYTSLTLQHGNSPMPALPTADVGGGPFPVTAYAFRPDLSQDIATAALVISHAGAGLILETLDAGRPLIVVVNRALMDDHQTELAVALAEKEVLVWTDADGLVETVERGGYEKLKAFGKADPSPLVAVLDQEAGFWHE